MAIEDFYRYLKRRISKCDLCESLYVSWAYGQLMQMRSFNFPNNIEKHDEFQAGSRINFLFHEWELEIITAEVILHARSAPQVVTKTLRHWRTLAAVVNRLRNLENELYGEIDKADVLVEMSRIIHRQIPWQQLRPAPAILYRYYRIFGDPAIDAICRKVIGLSIDDLYLHGIGAYIGFADHAALEFNVGLSAELEAFLAFSARPIAQIREMVAAAHRLDHAYAYRVGALRQFPLIIMERGPTALSVRCPLPTLLFWRVTSGLYYDLIKHDDFGNALGASFQAYVGEVLKRAITSPSLQLIAEAKYGTSKRPKATPDWLLAQGDAAAVFLECKAKRITVPGKVAMGDLAPLKADLEKLADAVVQLYERLSEYASRQFPNLAYIPSRKCYPVVVTLEDWYVFGERTPDLLQTAVEQEMRKRGVDPTWLISAPYAVLSVDELEEAAQIINGVGISAFFDGKLNNPEKRGWLFGSYLRTQFENEWQARKPLFRDEAEAMFTGFAELAARSTA